jgi:hypothetical protein
MSNLVSIRRVTVVADVTLKEMLLKQFFKFGAHGYTAMSCHGQGRHELIADPYSGEALVRLELLVQPDVADSIMGYLERAVSDNYAVTACSETVDVLSNAKF